MIDPTDFERDCMNKALRPLGEYVAEIGTDKAVLTLIEVVVTAYMDELSKGNPIEDFGEIPF